MKQTKHRLTVDQFRALSNRKAKGKKRDNPEERLHFEVAALLKKAGLLFYHGANEGDLPVQYRVKLKKKGTSPGVPDILIFSRGAAGGWAPGYGSPLAVELKVGYNKPSKEQHQWLADLRDEGWRCEVCYTMDEVMKVLRHHYPNKFLS
jgi:hypothetical protein